MILIGEHEQPKRNLIYKQNNYLTSGTCATNADAYIQKSALLIDRKFFCAKAQYMYATTICNDTQKLQWYESHASIIFCVCLFVSTQLNILHKGEHEK